MEKKIILRTLDKETIETLLQRTGVVLVGWEDCRQAMASLVSHKKSVDIELSKEEFIFLVREAARGYINDCTSHNLRFAEALYEYLLNIMEHKAVITDLLGFLDNIWQDMCCGEYLADGLKRVEVKDIPFGEDKIMKEVRKIYKDVFQASNGYWIFVHRMESIKIN